MQSFVAAYSRLKERNFHGSVFSSEITSISATSVPPPRVVGEGEKELSVHGKALLEETHEAPYRSATRLEHFNVVPQWGTAGAEIKVPSDENTEVNGSPFKALSKSVYIHACYAYCQGFLPC